MQELSSKRVVLRLRFYDHDQKAVLTVKGKQVGGRGWAGAGASGAALRPGCVPSTWWHKGQVCKRHEAHVLLTSAHPSLAP